MKYSKTVGLISLCGHLLFLAAFLLMHWLRPDKSVMSSFTSEFAVGDSGWLMTLGFLGVAAGALFLGIGLLKQFKPAKTSLFILGIWSTGMLIAGVFKTDLPGFAPTPAGLFHGIAALIAFISLGIAMISWGTVFSENRHWRPLGKLSFIFGTASLVLFIIFFLSPPSFRGLTQRILIVWDLCWLLLVNRMLLLQNQTNTAHAKNFGNEITVS